MMVSAFAPAKAMAASALTAIQPVRPDDAMVAAASV